MGLFKHIGADRDADKGVKATNALRKQLDELKQMEEDEWGMGEAEIEERTVQPWFKHTPRLKTALHSMRSKRMTQKLSRLQTMQHSRPLPKTNIRKHKRHQRHVISCFAY
jgi:hypothetical protein